MVHERPFKPSTQGAVERVNEYIKSILIKLSIEYQTQTGLP